MHIGVTTIHFGIGIKPGTTLLGLNNKSKAVLRNKLSEVKFFVKYELSMVLIDLQTDNDSRYKEVFMIVLEKAFAVFLVMKMTYFNCLQFEESLYFPDFLIKVV